MTSTRNIFLIGRTGSGKSTLANVITGTSKFKEGQGSTSETKEIQIEDAEISGVKYRIIDTVGIGDTGMEEWEMLYELAKMSSSASNGLSQILFLTDSSGFTKDTKEIYELLRKCFFDGDIAKYTTIVRTHFPKFGKKDKCEQEEEKMLESNGDFGEIMEQMSFIYVDNPPIDVEDKDEEELNREKRNKSKKILKDRLEEIFEGIDTGSEEGNYKPVNLDKLNEVIRDSMKFEERLISEEIFGEDKKLKLEKLKKEITRKTLHHVLEIDPSFSKKEKIEEQLKILEMKEKIQKIFLN